MELEVGEACVNASLRCVSRLPPAVTHMDAAIHPSNARPYQVLHSHANTPSTFPSISHAATSRALALWLMKR